MIIKSRLVVTHGHRNVEHAASMSLFAWHFSMQYHDRHRQSGLRSAATGEDHTGALVTW
jgi:hypothetical protein